jgi:hypothetical protein
LSSGVGGWVSSAEEFKSVYVSTSQHIIFLPIGGSHLKPQSRAMDGAKAGDCLHSLNDRLLGVRVDNLLIDDRAVADRRCTSGAGNSGVLCLHGTSALSEAVRLLRTNSPSRSYFDIPLSRSQASRSSERQKGTLHIVKRACGPFSNEDGR